MKNSKALWTMALVGLVSFGGAAYYYKNNSNIEVSFEQAKTIVQSYKIVEACKRAGELKKSNSDDLENIVYRMRIDMSKVQMDNIGTGYKFGHIKKPEMENEINQGVDAMNNDVTSDLTGLTALMIKNTCEQFSERAKNLKVQYK